MRHRGIVLLASLVGCNAIFGIEPLQGTTEPPCTDTSCDDGNPCTTDTCDVASQVCNFVALDNTFAPEQVEGDCQRIACSLGTAVPQTDDTDVPEDASDCTDDLCTLGEPSNEPHAEGTACNTNGGEQCNDAGLCVGCLTDDECSEPDTCIDGFCNCIPATSCELSCGEQSDTCGGTLDCDNDATDGTESDVDCGGDTATCERRCDDGLDCTLGTDCVNGACVDNICSPGLFTLGIEGTSQAFVSDVALDVIGNIYVVGWFGGELTLGSETTGANREVDAFLAKIRPDGDPEWIRKFGDMADAPSDAEERALGLATAVDGTVVVAGWFNENIHFAAESLSTKGGEDGFVVALNPNGTVKWSRALAGKFDDRATAVAIDENNGQAVVLGSHQTDFVSAPPEQEGIYVARLALATGQLASMTSFEGYDVLPDDIVIENEDALISGSFEDIITLGSDVYDVGGSFPDVFLARVDSSGTVLWSRSVGDGENGDDQFATKLALGDAGVGFLTGSCDGDFTLDSDMIDDFGIWVGRFDTTSGAFEWARGITADTEVDAPHVVVGSDGNPLVAFWATHVLLDGTEHEAIGIDDTMLLSLDATTGTTQYFRQYAGHYVHPGGLTTYPSGHVVIAGDYDEGPVDFMNGADPLNDAAVTDVFVTRFIP